MQEDTYAGEYNDPLSLNLYAYCKNETIRYSAPTGHRYDEGDKSNKVLLSENSAGKDKREFLLMILYHLVFQLKFMKSIGIIAEL